MLWCLITEPSGTIHELILPRDVKGSECLEKICSRLHMIERDYFGLRFRNQANDVEFWLNLRNALAPQLTGKAPFRLKLCVKFFVTPQELQQQITRDMFYFACRSKLKKNYLNISKMDDETLAKLYSYVAQAEMGEYSPESVPDYSALFPCGKWNTELEQSIESFHLDLDRMPQEESRIQVLHILSNVLEYGVETFHVNSATAKNTKLRLVCRSDGLRIYRDDTSLKKKKKTVEKQKEGSGESEVVFIDKCTEVSEKKESQLIQFIPYEEISTVSYKGKLFTISYGDASLHNQKKLGFKLKVQQATIDLFRTFTEFHSFYQCNMVKKSVMEKCTRNSVGRIASFFRPNTKIGRTYLFDVLKTRRQVYNATWKELNASGKRRQSLFYSSDRGLGKSVKGRLSDRFDQERNCHSVIIKRRQTKLCAEDDTADELPSKSSITTQKVFEDASKINTLSAEDLKEFVRTLQDSRTCQVCMDAEVSTAFCPCGHVICCVQCSALVKECPLCRAHITYAQRVFFSCEQQSL